MKYAHDPEGEHRKQLHMVVRQTCGDGSDDNRKFDRSVDGIILPKDHHMAERAKKITGRVLEAAQEVMKAKAEQWEHENGKWTRQDQQTDGHTVRAKGGGKPEQRENAEEMIMWIRAYNNLKQRWTVVPAPGNFDVNLPPLF